MTLSSVRIPYICTTYIWKRTRIYSKLLCNWAEQTLTKQQTQKKGSSRSCDILSLPVCSNSLGLYGVIDLYRGNTATLIERKLRLNHIFRWQLYQLWGQYFCMIEMGYEVNAIAFYEISTNKILHLLPRATFFWDKGNMISRKTMYP